MAQDIHSDEFFVTKHAVQRFKERIQDLPEEEIEAWLMKQLKLTKKYSHSQRLRKRELWIKGRRTISYYWQPDRAPNGKPMWFGISHDLKKVITVITAEMYSQLKYSRKDKSARQTEWLMKRIKATEEAELHKD